MSLRQNKPMKSKLTLKKLLIEKNFCASRIDIRDQLLKHGWCSRLSAHLSTIDLNEMEQIEKLLRAMISLTDGCRSDFVSSSRTILDKLHHIYSNRHLADDSIHRDILLHLKNLQQDFQQDL